MSPSIQSTVGAASGRNVAVVAAVIVAVDAVGPIIQWIKDQNWDNQRRRSEFTRVIVRDLSRNDPRFNYVICRTRHEVRFDGQPDVDFTRRQVSMPIRWGFRGITYDLYAFRSGAFCLLGDGGYLDWARYGIIASDSRGRQPRTIVFSNPV
ncbi:hypothetical protein BJ912DRAFT_959048 [Pholiota molesta]|nr:hypothetical protein BJ912DRAFT_959048 [Pholiota molesta]